MSINPTYLVTLRPTGNFYFGSEKHFSFNGVKNYLVKSNPFPQQTTLLGMLRYELLRKAGLLNGVDKAKETALIGAAGFNGSQADGYGIIKSLSPVFLHNLQTGENFVPKGACYQKGQPIVPDGTEAPVLLKGYDAKEDTDDAFINPVSGATVLLDDIYLYPTQTGNQKNNKAGTDEEALYKQTFCRFANRGKSGEPAKWSFAFYLETTVPLPLDNNVLVSIGGDQGSFVLTHQPTGNQLFATGDAAFEKETDVKITLLSDARSDTDLCSLCYAAIAGTTNFRYIETTAQTKNYYNVTYRKDETKSDDMLRSNKYSLYKAGAVFWLKADKVTAFTEALEQPAFKLIGYNYYKTEKITN